MNAGAGLQPAQVLTLGSVSAQARVLLLVPVTGTDLQAGAGLNTGAGLNAGAGITAGVGLNAGGGLNIGGSDKNNGGYALNKAPTQAVQSTAKSRSYYRHLRG
ncbi:hypothetical protein PF008_g15215 [Phytophthora fragariae]|uniref:Uncharacterized protein n=1 Tax=Phytophthora fragariae TaxID=53985 RepID=A0A6G0RG36_9STRA|nr:hypothetical protein PF008_g15215 [Phytophthora fragariae]